MPPTSMCLRGVSPKIASRHWESDTLLRVGRLAELEVIVDDESISRRHAEIARAEEGWVVRDLGSTNGTFLNGIRVGRGDQRIKMKDILRFGNLDMSVSFREAPATFFQANSFEDADLTQATVKQSWDESLQAVMGPDGLRHGDGRLVTLMRAGRDLTSDSLDSLLQSTLTEAVTLLEADRAVILLGGESGTQLLPRATHPLAWPGARTTLGAARRAFAAAESVLGDAGGPVPSSSICALLRTARNKLGVLFIARFPGRSSFTRADLLLADAFAASVAGGIEGVGVMLDKERDHFLHTITALAQAVELRDDYTGSHTQRVTDYALLLARELALPEVERQHLRIGAPLHDIGKIGIRDAILLKAEHLTPEEFAYMKSHTWKGAAMLEAIPHLRALLPIVRNHHERYDGRGYPDGLVGEAIPPLARVVSVADAFDAMTTDRPYRPGMEVGAAFEEIQRRCGSQFDPECAQAFLRLRPRLEQMLREHVEVSQTSFRRRDELLQDVADVISAPLPRPGVRRTQAIALPTAAEAAAKQGTEA